jgi:pyroglutamyl-peptidase
MLNILNEQPLKTKPTPCRTRHGLRIAITGFGPFPGVPFNASERLVHDLAEAAPRLPHGAQLYAATLPTDWLLAMDGLAAFMREVKPHIALHFGVSSRAKGFVIETRAYNQTSARPDWSGRLAQARCVRRGAPASVDTRLPVVRLLQRLRMNGIPAALSTDPGRYLCNAVMFRSVCGMEANEGRASAAHSPVMAGFVHIPALAPGDCNTDARFGWHELRRGSAIILDTLARGSAQGAARSGRPCISLR